LRALETNVHATDVITSFEVHLSRVSMV